MKKTFESRYTAKQPDLDGFVTYNQSENEVWRTLYTRQRPLVEGRACDEFLNGLEALQLKPDAIPQLPNVNEKLSQLTGWQVVPVAALISPEAFFNLLANRQFPAATFIRAEDALDYVTEPDIFHELFGHCPMLTEPSFADFVCQYAAKVLTMPKADWLLLQRLFWFTVEFGLIQTPNGLRIYGGGITSSFRETKYAVEDKTPKRLPFDVVEILRTPYRIDQLQPIYFVIDEYAKLYQLLDDNLDELLSKARTLGEHAPLFPVDDSASVHMHAC